MITPPTIIVDLITRIEKGEEITPAEMQRIALLQSLYVANIGEDYLMESIETQALADADLKQAIGV